MSIKKELNLILKPGIKIFCLKLFRNKFNELYFKTFNHNYYLKENEQKIFSNFQVLQEKKS
jgi:hypothetical protein